MSQNFLYGILYLIVLFKRQVFVISPERSSLCRLLSQIDWSGNNLRAVRGKRAWTFHQVNGQSLLVKLVCQASHARNVPDGSEYKYRRSYLVPPPTLPFIEINTIFALHLSRILRAPLKPRIVPSKRVYSRSMSRSDQRNARNARDEDDETELPSLTPQKERKYGRVSTRLSPSFLD